MSLNERLKGLKGRELWSALDDGMREKMGQLLDKFAGDVDRAVAFRITYVPQHGSVDIVTSHGRVCYRKDSPIRVMAPRGLEKEFVEEIEAIEDMFL